MRYRLYSLLWTSLDWVFPPNCGGCAKLGERWCQVCNEKTRKIALPICEICGQSTPHGEICYRCLEDPPHFSALRSWAIFGGPIRNGLHALKYRGNLALGEALSRPMIDLVQKTGWNFDMVMPVPLGAARLKERGYNQASLLARPLALKFNLPYPVKSLKRMRETNSQVELNRQERKKNVVGAFQADHKVVAGKSVLMVDDVTTSGSTLDACAEALLQAGAQKVFGLTLARAELKMA